MAGERLSVDELVARQDEPAELRATVEAVQDDDERVKVTPYVSGVGCLCSQAIVVRKRQIESVVTTDETHRCCGKTLTVVTVTFADATLADVFGQLSESARRSRDMATEPVAVGGDPGLFLRRPFPRPAYYPYLDPYRMVYGNYDPPRQIWSTEEAATGHSRLSVGPTPPSPALLRRCMRAQIQCQRDCARTSDPNDPYGEHGWYKCSCECDQAYFVCLDPTYARSEC